MSLADAHVVSRDVSEFQVKAEEVKTAMLPSKTFGNCKNIGRQKINTREMNQPRLNIRKSQSQKRIKAFICYFYVGFATLSNPLFKARD